MEKSDFYKLTPDAVPKIIIVKMLLGAVVLALLCPGISFAEWADPSQIPTKYEILKIKMSVKKDGTYTRRATRQVVILSDEGRNKAGTFSFRFNKHTEKGSVIVAQTINDGKVFKVANKDIETKEVREKNRKGFESNISKMIAFPNVYVGSRVYIEYEVKGSEFPHIDSWSTYLSFDDMVAEKVEIDIDSEMPLQIYLADDKFILEKSADSKKIHLTNRGQINTLLVNEPYYSVQENRAHGILVTTASDWNSFGKAFIKEYDKVASANLPAALERIINETASIQDPVERMNQITSRLQKNIRYFGDWARRKGGYVPRSLAKIVETEFGDCKDMAVTLVAMLRKAGYKADVALVKRGDVEKIDEKLYGVASGSVFNHAITRAQVGEKVYWLDPTNAISFAQGIPLDIADRPAFVLYKSGGVLERTTSYNPEENVYGNEVTFHITKTGEVKVDGFFVRKGIGAYKLLRAEWRRPAQVIERSAAINIVGHEDIAEVKFEEYPKTINIVQDVERKFSTSLRSFPYVTNEGLAFPFISKKVTNLITLRRPSHEGDIVFGEKYIEQTSAIYKNVSARNLKDFNCKIETKWMDLQREALSQKGDVLVKDVIKIKQDIISKAEAETPEFLQLQAGISNCYLRRMIIFR